VAQQQKLCLHISRLVVVVVLVISGDAVVIIMSSQPERPRPEASINYPVADSNFLISFFRSLAKWQVYDNLVYRLLLSSNLHNSRQRRFWVETVVQVGQRDTKTITDYSKNDLANVNIRKSQTT